MKRSELYLRVWQTPLSKLAPALGLSDVGLSKMCKRFRIPVPTRGHWAKVAAGQHITPKALPSGEDVDMPLSVRRSSSAQSSGAEVRTKLYEIAKAARASTPLPVGLEVRATLAGCHAIVSRTAKAFDELRRESEAKKEAAGRMGGPSGRPNLHAIVMRSTSCGRYWTPGEGGLSITATLTNIDWILRFHDALIRGLIGEGCEIVSRSERDSSLVEVRRSGESVRLKFLEDYEKIDPPKVRTAWWSRAEYRPLETYRVKLERHIGASMQWRGTTSQLEAMLPEIVRYISSALKAQAGQRVVLEAEEARRREHQARHEEERRLWFAAQKRIGERRAARSMQVDRALLAATSLANAQALTGLLAEVERAAGGDQGVSTWIEIVRAGLQDPVGRLVAAIRAEWSGAEPPLWASPSEGSDRLPPEPTVSPD